MVMKINEIDIFKMVEENFGENLLKEALKITTDDIKANNISLGKKTSTKEFMGIFFKSLKLCVKIGFE